MKTYTIPQKLVDILEFIDDKEEQLFFVKLTSLLTKNVWTTKQQVNSIFDDLLDWRGSSEATDFLKLHNIIHSNYSETHETTSFTIHSLCGDKADFVKYAPEVI